MSEERLTRIESKIDDLVSGQLRMEKRLDGLEGRMDQVEVRLEETTDMVKQIAGSHAVLLSTMERGFQSLSAESPRFRAAFTMLRLSARA
jgi:hypothetical protein